MNQLHDRTILTPTGPTTHASLNRPKVPLPEAKRATSTVANTALRQREPVATSDLSKYSGVHLKTADLPQSAHKSNTLIKKVFDTRAGRWLAEKLYRGVRIFKLFGFQKKQSKVNNSIDELSGSLHLSKAIHALTPFLAKLIKETLVVQYKGLSELLEKEHCTIQSLIEILLSQIYVNIAKNINETSEGRKGPVQLLDIVGSLCALVNSHLPRINAAYDTTAKIADPIKRERKLAQLFVPLVEDFLQIALPKGTVQLPFNKVPLLSNWAWNNLHATLQTEYLPKLFLEAYRQMSDPLNGDKKKALQSMPGGDSLASLAELSGRKTGENLPNIFTDDNEPSKGALPDFMKSFAKILSPLFQGSEKLQEWLGNWTAQQIVDIAKTDNHDINQLRMLLGGYVEPLLVHVFFNLADLPAKKVWKGHDPDALSVILIRLFSLYSAFLNKNGNAIESRLEALKVTKNKPEHDETLLQIFAFFARDLFVMMGLDKPEMFPVPSFLQNIVAENLYEFAPRFLLRQYLAVKGTINDDDPTRKKLRSLMFDPANLGKKEVAVQVISTLHAKGETVDNMFEEFYQNLWDASGTESVVQTMEKMCKVFASELVGSILRKFGVGTQTVLISRENTVMHQTITYLNKLVESMLLEAVISIIETTNEKVPQAEGVHPKRVFPLQIILRLSGMVQRGLHNVDQKLCVAATIAKKDKRLFDQMARQAFTNLAAEFYEARGKNFLANLPLSGLPAEGTIKNVLWSSIKETLLPDLLRIVYSEMTAWHYEMQRSLETLERLYHTSHPLWASRVLSQFVSDWLRNYLTNSSDDAAKALVHSILHYFNNGKGIDGKVAKLDIEDRLPEVQALAGENLRGVGISEAQQLENLWPTITIYVEGIVAKFLAEISKTVSDIETENPDFLVDMAITMLKDTAEYFEAANKVSEDSEQSKNNPLLAALGTDVHDGVPLDPKASPDEKERVRLQGHFIPLAAKLFDLANITIDDLPIPSGFRTQLGELILTKFLPKAMLQSSSKILEHSMRDALMLKFVQTLHAALNSIKPVKEETADEPKNPQEPKQKHLIETCGTVVRELASRIPDTMVQYVFMKEKVKNMSAEAIGEAMMPHLSKWTLLHLMDAGIYHGLPKFHPSYWKGKAGRENLIPRKAAIKPDGKMEIREATKFKFVFLKTPAEFEAELLQKTEEARKTRLKLRDDFTSTISSQLLAKTWAGIKSLWTGLQVHFDDFFERIFGHKGLKFKSFVDKVLHKVFFDIIGTAIQFLTLPFIKLMQYIIEKNYINKRSEDIIEGFHSDALEHLMYKWTDALTDGLLRLRDDKRKLLQAPASS